jgi:CubicO group peptidase (beta-lactamase class C family)
MFHPPCPTRPASVLLAGLAALGLGLGRAVSAPAAPPGRQAYDFAPVTEFVRELVADVPLDGAALTLVRHDAVVYEQSFGSYGADTEVYIASAGKWLAASVVMRLVDDGVLSLDEPIGPYLPSFTGRKAAITLRQLLSHTSGLPGTHPCIYNAGLTLAACVDQIAGASLRADPGTEFRYGNVSYQVAGRVAELAAGRPWVELFEAHLAGPLEMSSTAYLSSTNPLVEGGITSTLADYRHFVNMQRRGGLFGGLRVLSEAAVAEMSRSQIAGLPIADSPHNDGRRYGLGVWLDREVDGFGVQVSSQGFSGVSPWLDRERDLAAVLVMDSGSRNLWPRIATLQRLVRTAVDEAGLPTATATADITPTLPTPTASPTDEPTPEPTPTAGPPAPIHLPAALVGR